MALILGIGGANEENIYYDVIFEQVHVNNSPRIQEIDDAYKPVFPHEARIRNLTYATEIYVDVRLVKLKEELPEERGLKDGTRPKPMMRVLHEYKPIQAFLGKVPVMVRSNFCHLKTLNDNEKIRNAKECIYD